MTGLIDNQKALKMVISNKIIEAHFSLPLSEQRLLYAYISKLSEAHFEFPELELSVKEFSEILGVEINYKAVKQQCIKLLQRVIEIQTEDRLRAFQWFSECELLPKQGKLSLKIHEALKPYLLQLKTEFTKFLTKQVMHFRSVYSIRIYMLCKQYQAIGKRTMEVEELRKKLGIAKEEYKKYNDLKRFVFGQALKEINGQSDIEIELEEVKKGRKIASIIFKIGPNHKNEFREITAADFQLKSKNELSKMLISEIKKRWKTEFRINEISWYKKETFVELLCSIWRGVYDEKTIINPNVYFKAALNNIESGNSIY